MKREYGGFPASMTENETEELAQEAMRANQEALSIFEDLQHPTLGTMYLVMGGMYADKYSTAKGFERGTATGPQHGEWGDEAIQCFEKGVEAFEKTRLKRRLGVWIEPGAQCLLDDVRLHSAASSICLTSTKEA